MPSAVLVFGGCFLALMGLWGVNHEDAVGSAGFYTSWLSPRTRAFLAWFVMVGGLAMAFWGVVAG